MSRWNGHRFLRKRTLYHGPEGFSGFTGLNSGRTAASTRASG